MNVTVSESNVVQSDNFYPFGLTFNSYQRVTAKENKWKFQGQEHIDDLGLNWDSFKWRNHQPDIGRFFNVDPLAEKYLYNSPYAFSENKVIVHRELEGLEAFYINAPGGIHQRRNAHSTWGQRTGATIGATLRHPVAASAVGEVVRGGTNISSVSGRIARHVAENGNMTVDLGSERNAFRHALWQATITSEFGENAAIHIGNAHEGVKSNARIEIDFSEAMSQNMMSADQITDALNNVIGRSIGENIGEGASQVDIAREVLQVYRNEGLWVASEDDDGNLTVTRQTISQEQFDAAMEQLNTLDENGMNEIDRQELENE